MGGGGEAEPAGEVRSDDVAFQRLRYLRLLLRIGLSQPSR